MLHKFYKRRHLWPGRPAHEALEQVLWAKANFDAHGVSKESSHGTPTRFGQQDRRANPAEIGTETAAPSAQVHGLGEPVISTSRDLTAPHTLASAQIAIICA
jgi:hypothetical protein